MRAVNIGRDFVPVELVSNDVNTEFHEVSSACPAQVVDPLIIRFGIVLIGVAGCVQINRTDSSNVKYRGVVNTSGRDALNSKLFYQIAPDRVDKIGIDVEGSANAEFIDR